MCLCVLDQWVDIIILIPGAVETLFKTMLALDTWLLSDGCPGVSSHLA